MKLRKVIILLMLISLAFLIVGCSSNDSKESKIDSDLEVYYPDWYDKQDNAEYVYFFGEGVQSTTSLARKAARSNAIFNASMYLDTYVQGMIKTFEQESGVNNTEVLGLTKGVVKVLSESKIRGLLIDEHKMIREGSKFKAFVRLKLPKSEVDRETFNAIKNEEALYNQFKASQTFQEMETEFKKMDN